MAQQNFIIVQKVKKKENIHNQTNSTQPHMVLHRTPRPEEKSNEEYEVDMSRMISHQKVIDWCYYLLLITVCSIQAKVGDSEHPFQRSLRKDKYVKNYKGD